MHAKHRNGPGSGYRGNAMGMSSIAGSSRSPSEGPMRGHRMYNPEYRNYNRGGGGYGRGGHSKHFQHQTQPIRETDILIEAGRLAAEYLISKDLLSPAALSGGSFEGRSHKGEVSDGRVSVHSRLGNVAPDMGQGRRRYPDDYALSSRSFIKGRKRADSLRINGADGNRDLRRTGSLSKNSKTNASDAHDDDQTAVEDGGLQSSSLGENNPEVENEILSNSADAKDGPLSNEVSEPSDAEGQALKIDDNKEASEGLDEKEEAEDLHQSCVEETEVKYVSKEIDASSDDHADLLKHCKFVSFPTKPRSSLTVKGSRSNQHSVNEEKNAHVMDTDIGSSVCNDSSYQKHEAHLNVTDSPSVENNVGQHCTKRPGECSRSGSKEQERDDSLSSFGTSNSMLKENGKKRIPDYDGDGIDFKKIKKWTLPPDMQSDCISQLSSPVDNRPVVQDNAISVLSDDEKGPDISLSRKVHNSFQFMEEKHLFPASFKTCDLNLNENHEADSTHALPSSKKSGNASVPIDIDLSMSNTSNVPITNGKPGVGENRIEVIDLEKGELEVESFGNPDGRGGETLFNGLDDGFPNNLHNASGISDVHDGFGLMISEYLGNNSPNCSSVPTDMNSLHNQMFLPNNEGILGDDDSIYMSLGEIPIGLLRGWEQPTQDFGKPF